MTNEKMNISSIPDISQPELAQRLRHKLDSKTKPLGSLGRIEDLALQIGLVLGTTSPWLERPQLVVFAADHGLAAQGVSAYPSDVTAQMVRNFLRGGAAVSVLARQHGLQLTIVDCGVRHEFAPQPGLVIRKIASGTMDSSQGPAMTAAQCEQALANGSALVDELPGNALLLGEMGIGNTSAASLLLARLTGEPIAECVGAGTGLDEAGIERKRKVLVQVLAFHARAVAPLEALAAFGGFEIATMVGAVLQAARQRRVIVVDGFISTAAVLVAQALAPHVVQRCVFSHRSGECGHALMLRHLGPGPETPARALLQLDLRLGEGSGAALAWPLLDSACALLRDMATFESAGVSKTQ
jgi:nicotinate-nucleotide--dimethylbenzimidazole phosphoribosyltransferase